MKKISVENMSTIQGGGDMCTFNSVMLGVATIALYTAPFTAGGGLAIAVTLVALGSFVASAYGVASSCR